METRVILISSGVTDWHEQGRLVGQDDRRLSDAGREQAERAAAALSDVAVSELLTSPLQRAVQTAEAIGRQLGIDVARDQRLSALALGDWRGKMPEELAEDPEYQRFLARPTDMCIPGGETLEAARRRAVAAIEQGLGDAAVGDVLAVVTHSAIIRMVIGHYLGAPVSAYMRMRVDPGSFSIVGFHHGGKARILAINWHLELARLVAST